MEQQPKLIRKIKTIPSHERRFIPVEAMVKDMSIWEQYAAAVIDYTSRCNMTFITSYAPDNLVGEYVKYPSYGDCPETFTLRTYGKWWADSEASQEEYMPQEFDILGAEDYITLGFETPVVPRDVCIYETYNPGAVVRIWGRYTDMNWKLLWEGPPTTCPEESRKFHPCIRKVNCLVNEIRLEFNQRHLKYHTAIDAVLLGGYKTNHILQKQILQKDLLDWGLVDHYKKSSNQFQNFDEDFCNFSTLPHEVVLHIFKNLDLKSLSRCAQVNRKWHEATLDAILYQNLSLKRYWHKVTGESLDFFKKRCRGVRKLDLSWCGNHDKTFNMSFIRFFQQCCQHLTHLSLNHCSFPNTDTLSKISYCKDLTQVRLRNTKSDPFAFQHLVNLRKLTSLDVGLTTINDDSIIAILKANADLRHLNLDFCEGLERLDQVVETAATSNRLLTTWSSFKATSLTSFGAVLFARCVNLRELDLGWCLLAHPGDCLEKIAIGCKGLKRLIVCCWRGLNDQMLLPVILHCKNITQLDLLGIKTITGDVCEKALTDLPKLRLLDISYCDSISNEQVAVWREEYSHVTIQRSCQYEVIDYFN